LSTWLATFHDCAVDLAFLALAGMSICSYGIDNFAHTGILNHLLVYPMFALSHLFAGDNLYRILHIL
jgi:hypothetical protein